jgi:hypothetical protein
MPNGKVARLLVTASFVVQITANFDSNIKNIADSLLLTTGAGNDWKLSSCASRGTDRATVFGTRLEDAVEEEGDSSIHGNAKKAKARETSFPVDVGPTGPFKDIPAQVSRASKTLASLDFFALCFQYFIISYHIIPYTLYTHNLKNKVKSNTTSTHSPTLLFASSLLILFNIQYIPGI